MAFLHPANPFCPLRLSSFSLSRQSACLFSSSSLCQIRQRPSRRLRPADTSPNATSCTGPKTGLSDKKPEDFETSSRSSYSSSQDKPSSSQKPVDEAPTLNKPSLPTTPLIKGMKAYQQNLFQRDSIYFKAGATQPSEVTKQDRPPLAAAEKFFGNHCRFLYSADALHHHAENNHIPEIVVLGASNAGKSSFLNALVGGMEMAKVSHRPGKTTMMNAYGIGPRPKIARELVRKGNAPPKHSLVLVDTPGYGYKSRADWGKTIMKYLNMRKMLRGAVVLIPADKKLQNTDRWILRTLARSNTRTLVVITKADKRSYDWPAACHALSVEIQKTMRQVDSGAASSRTEGTQKILNTYVTAAKMDLSRRLGNGGGIGGTRLAILDMAGFSLRERVEKQPEAQAYTGTVVSFDDIVWKS